MLWLPPTPVTTVNRSNRSRLLPLTAVTIVAARRRQPPSAAVSRHPPSLLTAAIGTEEEDEEMRAKKSPQRPVMPLESLRFELEQSSSLSDDADVAGRAATATTWASSFRGVDCDKFDDDDDNDDGGNDDKFFHEIANYGPAPSLTVAAAATAATDNDGSGS